MIIGCAIVRNSAPKNPGSDMRKISAILEKVNRAEKPGRWMEKGGTKKSPRWVAGLGDSELNFQPIGIPFCL
jgi:hypothetical protein